MSFIENFNLIDATQLLLITVLVYGATNGIKNTKKIPIQYMPFLAMLLGLVFSSLIALVFHDDLYKAMIAGLLVGGWTSGLFDGFQAFIGDDKVGENK
ncbi:holin [Companilactobacillus nantensis]|uniref:Holin n=1 Tax=Companilactobacillus nantensis DSM 16982 TaxID=1423774 RepID=A0A0R1WHN0_9LACO|nr:holin [Companilactobacillus nantensis]KRM17249.1 hypothetical protein FD31_GL000327 [Companilactobacillus nantensis DSM 16982]GEO64025.1 hypothetical protein LNA01_12080 [Companilactobacillus nantensis]